MNKYTPENPFPRGVIQKSFVEFVSKVKNLEHYLAE